MSSKEKGNRGQYRESVKGLAEKVTIEMPEDGFPTEVVDALADLLIDMTAKKDEAA